MNVNFEICPPSSLNEIAPRCTYCDFTLNREKYIKIKFDTMSKTLNIHEGECWDNFVVGVSIINDQLTALAQN